MCALFIAPPSRAPESPCARHLDAYPEGVIQANSTEMMAYLSRTRFTRVWKNSAPAPVVVTLSASEGSEPHKTGILRLRCATAQNDNGLFPHPVLHWGVKTRPWSFCLHLWRRERCDPQQSEAEQSRSVALRPFASSETSRRSPSRTVPRLIHVRLPRHPRWRRSRWPVACCCRGRIACWDPPGTCGPRCATRR